MRDCHAEVLARRGLLRFLLSELKEFFLQYESSTEKELSAGKESVVCEIGDDLCVLNLKCNEGSVEDHRKEVVSSDKDMSSTIERCTLEIAPPAYQNILQEHAMTFLK